MHKAFSKGLRGFTLIELLVVIAIIGILASVVLVSLNSARSRGEDAAVKANLSGVRTQAELVYDTDGDYDDVCTDGNVSAAITAADGVCFDAAGSWTASAPLSVDHWCVDSDGSAGTTTSAATDALGCD